MKELQDILKKIAQFAPGENAILATVVDVKGSSYRLAGARMLIDANGNSIGTVSGGCLEADVLERAKNVLKTGEPAIITYDTTKNEDSVFGLGMGCRGIVRILMEKTENNPFIDFLDECFVKRKRSVVATLINKTNKCQLMIGMKFFFDSDGKSKTEIDKDMFGNISIDAALASKENRSFAKTYQISDFEGEFFIEVINPPTSLLLFGAGYDALPVADFAKGLGWRVSIIDHRAAWANAERFSNVDEIIVARAENLDDKLFKDENSVAVVMTHNYENDLKLLPRLMKSNLLYIGTLGPKKRTERILEESKQVYEKQQLENLYSPIGLDIGAETPEEIALAIISEIKTSLKKRNGGFLRERQGGIH